MQGKDKTENLNLAGSYGNKRGEGANGPPSFFLTGPHLEMRAKVSPGADPEISQGGAELWSIFFA